MPGVVILFVLVPLAIAKTRRMWKGTSASRASPDEAGPLERIEQAVESIAVEVERVSEGQRFVTRLMSDAKVPASQARALPESQRSGG